jgi:NDP-sugar pyrophosphorylase family protein
MMSCFINKVIKMKNKINIVIPLAGRGERFSREGFEKPKPLINFNGKTMIEYAIETLGIDGNFIFVAYIYQNENLNEELNEILKKYSEKIIYIDYITDGPASSALLAAQYINNDDPLIITNCDQIMEWDPNDFLSFLDDSNLDGVVVTYDSATEKNSYVKLNTLNLAEKFAEKQVISSQSLNGIHYWKKGSYFVDSTKKMIEKNIRVNGEFYISLSYNELIENNFKIGTYHLKSKEHNPVGTPDDLKIYINRKENGYQ